MPAHDRLSALLAHATGLSPSDVRIVERSPLEHQSNRLYEAWANGRHLILKEYLKADEFHDAPSREFRALEVVAPLDIAPRPVLLQAEEAPPLGPIVAYEFMEGAMWPRRPPSKAALGALAEVWLRLHAMPTEGLWLAHSQREPIPALLTRMDGWLRTYVSWVEGAFPAGRRAAKLCRDALERVRPAAEVLAADRPPLCFCRSDPRFANIIDRPDGRLGLVDWEDSGLLDPAREVADLLTHPNQEDLLAPGAWQAFLRPYLSGRAATDPQLGRRLHHYLALFPVFWLTLFLASGARRAAAGTVADWTINGLPANLRLRRYLARALAWPAEDYTDQLGALLDVVFVPGD